MRVRKETISGYVYLTVHTRAATSIPSQTCSIYSFRFVFCSTSFLDDCTDTPTYICTSRHDRWLSSHLQWWMLRIQNVWT